MDSIYYYINYLNPYSYYETSDKPTEKPKVKINTLKFDVKTSITQTPFQHITEKELIDKISKLKKIN
jgi:hypothetical protein